MLRYIYFIKTQRLLTDTLREKGLELLVLRMYAFNLKTLPKSSCLKVLNDFHTNQRLGFVLTKVSCYVAINLGQPPWSTWYLIF